MATVSETSIDFAWMLSIGCLCIGFLFDAMSIFYHAATIVTRKYMSGFPLVALFFYVGFVFTSPFALVAPKEEELSNILFYKMIDVVLLVAIHAACQSPILYIRRLFPRN